MHKSWDASDEAGMAWITFTTKGDGLEIELYLAGEYEEGDCDKTGVINLPADQFKDLRQWFSQEG